MRRVATFGAVLVALAVLYVAAWRTLPPASPTAAAPGATSMAGSTAVVTSVTRTCPPPAPNTGEAHIAVIAVPRQATAPAGAAQLSAIPFAPAATPSGKSSGKSSGKTAQATGKTAGSSGGGAGTATTDTASTSGQLTVLAAPSATQYGGTEISATGAMAQGFEAEEATSSGMGTVSCTHPGADMWFVGAGTAAGAPVTRLYLMNPGTVAASAEVTMLTDAGIQQGLNTAITVGAGQYIWENITQFTAGSVVLGLHVQTSSGQVAAAVWQGQSGGSGGTWLPQASAPATQVVIPGLTTASSAARLFVVVPGSADAKVKVKALTAHGAFLPFGPTPEDAPAAASSSFALSSLGASAAALVLTSNVPITAGIAVAGSGVGSFSAAAAPVTGQGVIAGNPVGGQSSVGLLLSAPGSTVTATITVLPEAGGRAPAPRAVQVPSGRTVAVAVQPPAGKQPFAIVVTPGDGSGPLYAARVVTSGGGLSGPVMSILPVPSAATEVTLPPIRDSYLAIMP
ncbi:MAG: hypothetical protein JWM19_3911 [Actinomycetia bacterium]|nr:hypothetical protein [Actinomycetes bacterium]